MLVLLVALLAIDTVLSRAQAPGAPTGVFVAAPPATSANPIAAPRLPGNTATLPNPTWAAAGVTGGIPVRARCTTGTGTSVLAAGVTAAQIETAIAGCDANHAVELGTGTFNLSGGIQTTRSDVTLKGQGADLTKIVMTGNDSCTGGFGGAICLRAVNISYYAEGPPPHSVAWSAGYTQGATSLTLANTSGLAVGMYLVLDQLNDSSDPGLTNVYVCEGPPCSDENGSGNHRPSRAQQQMVQVVSCAPACGSGSSSTVVIAPGLYMPNWRTGQTPQAWWGDAAGFSTRMGIEDLSIDANASSRCIAIEFMTQSWVKGVRCLNAATGNSKESHIRVMQAAHITIRDSYLYGAQNNDFSSGSQTYGIESWAGYDWLIENNIVVHRTSPFVADGERGSVYAYNYTLNDEYQVSPTFLQGDHYSHAGGNDNLLREGNDGIQWKSDAVHGSVNLLTAFRNYFVGWETGKAAETSAVKLYTHARFHNFVGNILGTNTYHTQYEWSVSGANGDVSIWSLGSPTNNVAGDALVKTTLFRWGNYDTVTDATQFVVGEVPSGLSFLPNPVPGSQTLPTSFYLTTKPAFFQAQPWPGIGPDITCADGDCPTGVGNHVVKNPAHKCHDAATNDPAYPTSNPRIKVFNRVSCYGT